jgi:hybrid cluster-associated redox disulfide protein
VILLAKVTKDMSITEIVSKYPDSVPVFMEHGMGCLGCAAARFESLEQGAMAHGIDVDSLINALNKALDKKAE